MKQIVLLLLLCLIAWIVFIYIPPFQPRACAPYTILSRGGACPRPSKLKNEPQVVVPTRARVPTSTENWIHVIGLLVLNAAEYESIPE